MHRLAAAITIVLTGLITAADTQAADWSNCQPSVVTESNISGCTKIIESRESNKLERAQAYFHRGATYGVTTQFDLGIADLSSAIKLRPDYNAAYALRCVFHYYKRERDSALKDCNTAIRLAPNLSSSPYGLRCMLYQSKGDNERAIADCDEAIRLNPQDFASYRTRGAARADQGNFDLAVTDLDEAIRLEPDDSASYRSRGLIYAAKQAYDHALADFDQAIRLEPQDLVALNGRAGVYAQRGDYDQAISDLDAVIRLKPDDPTGYRSRGTIYAAKQAYDRALADFDQAIRLSPQDVTALKVRAEIYAAKQTYDRALADFDQAIRLEPQDLVALNGRAGVYAQRGDYDKAISDLDAVIRLKPDDPTGYRSRGVIYAAKQAYDHALADLDQAIRLSPQDATALNGRAWVHMKRGDAERGLVDIKRAMKLIPNNPLMHDTRGHIFLALGRIDEAIADFNSAIDRGFKESPTYYGRGRAYELSGETERAREDFGKALTLSTNEPDYKWAKAEAEKGLARLLETEAASTDQAPPAERRIALVIGNARYQNVPRLGNPENDARAVAAAFRQLGFAQVVERHDLDLATLGAELKYFGDSAVGADWAVIFFAGHGLQVDGKSYLIPTDAKLAQAAHVEDEAIDVMRVIGKVREARKIRMVILDACRDNPFISKMQQSGRVTRSVSRGLAPIEPSGGVLVAYAARDGQVASDGETDHSPFTAALLRHIETVDLEINFLFRKVRSDVLAETGGVQEPFVYGSLPDERFYFKPPTLTVKR